MTLQPWNPNWRHPQESLWSLANKLAFAAVVSVRQVIAVLLGLDVGRRRSLCWLNDASAAVSACNALELNLSEAADLFWRTGTVSEEERAYLSLPLRWCPQCMSSSFHSSLFQDVRLARCPLHGCGLQDRCPSCQWPIDPLMERPWACTSCGHCLHRPPQDWPAAFRRPSERSLDTLSGSAEESAKQTSATPELGADVMSDWQLTASAAFCAFEESAALFDTLLRDSHAVAISEVPPVQLNYRFLVVGDPFAAAANYVAAWFGVATEAQSGVWPARRTFSGHPGLAWEMRQVHPSQRQRLVRALYRQWWSEAAGSFVRAKTLRIPPTWWPAAEFDLSACGASRLKVSATPRVTSTGTSSSV